MTTLGHQTEDIEARVDYPDDMLDDAKVSLFATLGESKHLEAGDDALYL